jgi:hypothetical protein
LPGSSVAFSWTAGANVSEYWLDVGTSLNGSNIYGRSQCPPVAECTSTSVTVSNLPTNGSTVYVKLWWRIGSSWSSANYTYTAAQ